MQRQTMFLVRILLALWVLGLPTLLLNRQAVAQGSGAVTISYVDTTNFPEVRIHVIVSDAQGNPVLGLGWNDFSLVERGASVGIEGFSNQLDQMFVVLMLDTTGTMLDPDPSGNLPINILENATTSFVQGLAPQDVVAIYTFNERAGLRCDFTTDRKVISDCINNINAESNVTFAQSEPESFKPMKF